MSHRILIVEDEQMIQEMYKLALESKGFIVDTASDGEEGLKKIQDQNAAYDLILLDVMMPKLDGISILRKTFQETSQTSRFPTYMLTNLALDDVIQEAKRFGALKCLIKSSSLPQQIIQEVENFFQKAPQSSQVDKFEVSEPRKQEVAVPNNNPTKTSTIDFNTPSKPSSEDPLL